VESGVGEGAEKALNAQHTMLPLPTGPVNKLYNPKHMESASSASIPKPLTIIIIIGHSHSYCSC